MTKRLMQSQTLAYLNSADLFATVAESPWAIFLDSGAHANASRASKHADYDVLAIQPICTLVFEQGRTCIQRDGATRFAQGDPLIHLQNELPDAQTVDMGKVTCPYLPGALGYCSYDLGRQYEELPNIAEDDERLPEMAMGIYSVVVVVDHLNQHTQIVWWGDEQTTQALVEQWTALIQALIQTQTTTTPQPSDNRLNQHFTESLNAQQYAQAFAKVRDYIVQGDCYQVNLTKRFAIPFKANSWQTYGYLRSFSPAPYGAYMNLPFAQILSNSPESFIQCRQQQVVSSPIKGTVARDHNNADNDRKLAAALRNSSKDRAENVMIVDLMRNDLSKSCELGSVAVPKKFAVHSFANVHHLISTVTGRLKTGLHVLDLLRSCFPGGSITGAPKVRAMQIIEELEPYRRGLYCGAIAYVGINGDLETNIAIRTIVIKDGVARFSAGGGLVFDSQLDKEYQELIDKSSMMSKALL